MVPVTRFGNGLSGLKRETVAEDGSLPLNPLCEAVPFTDRTVHVLQMSGIVPCESAGSLFCRLFLSPVYNSGSIHFCLDIAER